MLPSLKTFVNQISLLPVKHSRTIVLVVLVASLLLLAVGIAGAEGGSGGGVCPSC